MSEFWKTWLLRLAMNLVPVVLIALEQLSKDPNAPKWVAMVLAAWFLLKGQQSRLDVLAPAKK